MCRNKLPIVLCLNYVDYLTSIHFHGIFSKASYSRTFPFYFRIIFKSIEVLPRNNIILVLSVNEMKILFLYKNASLSRRGYEMSEKDTATYDSTEKKKWCHNSVFLLSIHHLTCVKCMYFSFSV